MVTRWWWAAAVAAAFVAGQEIAARGPDRHWSARDGDDWRAMAPGEQLAYTDGFLAGAAFGQVAQRICRAREEPCPIPGTAADSAGLDSTMVRLRRTGGFRLPFGANVYVSRMNDYYWWENHRPLPIWYGFWEVNATLTQSDR